MSGVSFYGVDFSNLDISMFSFIGDSNLENTVLKFQVWMDYIMDKLWMFLLKMLT